MLLEDIPEDSPFKDSLKGIYTSALRAKGLVKQILTFSRQDTNELKLMKMQPIIKEALKINQINNYLQPLISNKILILNVGVIKADPTQIHQIVMNLSTNAYHAMENDGGELKVVLKEVKLGQQDLKYTDLTPGRYACLTVSDTGIGISKDMIDKIFDPFFTTMPVGQGTGLGLTISYGIIQQFRGMVEVESEVGQGSTFTVTLPLMDEGQDHPTEEEDG